MKWVSFFNQWRRPMLFALAALLLHALVLGWVGARLAAPSPPAPDDEAVIAAHLQAPPLAPVPVPHALPAPRTAHAARALRRGPAAAPALPPSESMPGAEAPEEGPAAAGAALATRRAPVAPPPAPLVPEPAAPEPVAKSSVPTYTVDLPPPVEMELDVTSTKPNGNPSYGIGHLSWQAGAGQYRLRIVAGLNLVFTTLNLLEIESSGALGASGVEPSGTLVKRRGRSVAAIHFVRGESPAITFSAVPASVKLLPGAQDRASLIMQLAGIGRANAGQLSDNRALEMQVGDVREATVYGFYAAGFEDLDTALGTLHTWHVRCPPRPGSYSSAIDLWFAPSLNWYPVQIRVTEGSGAVTTQTVKKISAAEPATKKE